MHISLIVSKELEELRINSELHNSGAPTHLILIIRAASQTVPGQEQQRRSNLRLPIRSPAALWGEKEKTTLLMWHSTASSTAVPFRLQSRWITCDIYGVCSGHHASLHPTADWETSKERVLACYTDSFYISAPSFLLPSQHYLPLQPFICSFLTLSCFLTLTDFTHYTFPQKEITNNPV